MKFDSKTGEWGDPQARFLCSFGIGEGLAAIIAAGAADVGVGAATAGTIGTIGAGAVIGAGGGAALGAATGGDPGMGALTGAISGGAISGLGPVVGDTLGIGVIGGDALVGAGAGAVGAGITGSDPLTGAALGGVQGAATGALSGVTPSGASASGATAPGTSAAAIAPPSGATLGDMTASAVTPGVGDPGLTIDGTGPSGIGNLSSTISAASGGPGVGASGAGFAPLSADASAVAPGLTPGSVSPGGAGLAAPASAPGSLSPSTAVGAAAADKPNSIMTAINDPTWGNIGKAVGNNAAPLVAGGGLLYSLFNKPDIAGIDQLNAQAQAFQQQGASLESYLSAGKLPPGAQQALDLATKSAQANIKSRYAAMGMSGGTAEAQDLNNVTLQAQAQAFDIADKLLQQGIDESGLAASIYENLANIDIQQNGQTGSAIASLAAALGGGVQIKLG